MLLSAVALSACQADPQRNTRNEGRCPCGHTQGFGEPEPRTLRPVTETWNCGETNQNHRRPFHSDRGGTINSNIGGHLITLSGSKSSSRIQGSEIRTPFLMP